jgi:hypothetical protein
MNEMNVRKPFTGKQTSTNIRELTQLRNPMKIECRKTIKHMLPLLVHKQIHTCDKPYECKECRKTLKDLTVHQTTHRGQKSYEGNVCRKTFC